MRIIAGSRKGRPLNAPEGINTRPTLDRVKEALFGIIQFDLPGARVLDLFAGSGNLGLEALSRGAESAVFCDHDRKSIAVIRQNIAKLEFEAKSQVLAMDCAQAIKSLAAAGKKFDLVFLDPPYATDLAAQAIDLMIESGILSPKVIISVEHDLAKPPKKDGYSIDTRKYGYVGLSILKREDAY